MSNKKYQSLTGNKNAEKWTTEKVCELLGNMSAELEKGQHITLLSLLLKFGLYAEIWRHFKTKFADSETVLRSIKRIDTHFENELLTGALTGKYHAAVSIFLLKCNYQYKESEKTDNQDVILKLLGKIEII